MKDAESLRRVYNERFKGSSSRWTSEDIHKCTMLVSRVIRWAGIRKPEGLSMLDVGCALGYYTKAFHLKGFEAFGLDYSEVAVERARSLHPECTFIHADGFNPDLEIKFDFIFCRGFSGANTHDLPFVAEWTNKYIRFLNPGGKFVFSYSTTFSGKEEEGETANWTKAEIEQYRKMVNAKFTGIKFYYRYYFISAILSGLSGFFSRKEVKRYFYIIFSKE